MDRQNLHIQQQVDRWLELEKQGINQQQALALQDWLDTDSKHVLAYQESKQVELLLSQFSEQGIQSLEQSVTTTHQTATRTSQSSWAIAACFALLSVCLFSYLNWPTPLNSAAFQANYQTYFVK